MNKKMYAFLIMCLFGCSNVYAAPNIKTEGTYDENTDPDKCPTSIIIQDNLSGEKDIDFSDLDCIYYKMDNAGNFILDENGEKILREEDDELDFSCLQSFLDKYTNNEFKEAANKQISEGFDLNSYTRKYCPVYCVEENEFVFPGYAPVINSGGHFTWTVENWKDRNILDGLTVRLHGTKVCRSHIDLKQWIEDYKDVMKDIEKLIKTTNPTSNGNGSCTPNSNSRTDALTECGYNPTPISTSNHVITAKDYDVFKTYKELSDLAGTSTYSGIINGFGIAAGPSTGLATDAGKADANSNRYFITSAIYANSNGDTAAAIHNNKVNGYINVNNQNGHTIVFGNAETANNIFNSISNTSDSAVAMLTVKVQVWERHCCTWEKEGDLLPWSATTLSATMPVSRAGMATNTYGYQVAEQSLKCGSGSSIYDPPYENEGSKCCSAFENARGECNKYDDVYGCSDGSGLGKDQCILYGNQWVVKGQTCISYDTYKVCNNAPKTYYRDQKYVVVCPWGNTGEDKSIATGTTTEKCTTSSTPSCPSGYSYSPKTGKCYCADVNGISRKLNALANLRSALKQCQDILKDYDYYLETDVEVEYNKTNDSINNFYLPHQDEVTNTELQKISENTEEIDGENILGTYSSEIVHPSKMSETSGSISFFGKTYKFNKNGIPIPVCTLSGFQKICSAVNSKELADYWYDWYGKTYIAIYEYRLDDDFYRWVKMPSGESISTMPTGDYLKYNRFIDIGYANYPVHFSTPANRYDGLNIKITNIGYNNYLYNTYETQIENYHKTITDSDLKATVGENELLHDCYYEVKEGEPYCPTTGCGDDEYDLGSVRIIYRPISLENPFPDIDASGRDTGSNWCILNDEEETDCSNTNENVEKYILNNRNTSGSSIYSERQPMYEIILTPALIKEIREYNSTADYDDYNLSCSGINGEEGTKCRSNFVVDVPDIDKKTFKDAFNTSLCGMGEWNACDNSDDYER